MAITSNTYTGNGSNKLFSITFPYLDTADVDVYLNGTLQTVTTQYSFANATTIEFVTAPANGAAVRLDRSTDDSALQATFFPGSSIKAADLNADFDQTLYVVQEINNKAVKIDDPLYVNKTYVDNLALAAVPDGDRGDITVSGTGTVWTIDSGLPASRSSFTQAGTGAVVRTVDSRLKDVVSVKDFGAVGDGTANDTAAIQAALNTNKSLHFPVGVYLVDELTVPTGAAGSTYSGDGFYHYTNNRQTVIKARTLSQNSVFKLSSGADNITFRFLRIDGDSKASRCVDASFGAFLTFDTVGVYNGVNYGVYSKQGLMRINRCFMTGSGTSQCHMWSDSSATDSEFSTGATGLLLAAGGNRLVNVWANSCTNACVALRPFDNSTNHINTSIVNLYAGEVYNVNRPVIDIVGTAANRVQQVHISNSFIVTAFATPSKIDGGVYLEYVKDVSINNVQFRGIGAGYGASSYTPWSVFAADNVNGLTISNCTFRDINRNPIYLNSNVSSVTITGCSFQDWDIDQNAAGAEAAAIRVVSGQVSATGNNFSISGGQTQPYVLQATNANMVVFDNNYMSMPTPTLAAGTGIISGFNRYGTSGGYSGSNVTLDNSVVSSTSVNNASQNFLIRGQVSASGGSTTTLTTLANVATNQSYLVTVRQSGSGSNSVAAYAMAFGSGADAIRIAQSNTTGGALDMNITTSGLSIRLVLGGGYGATTWDWVLVRLG